MGFIRLKASAQWRRVPTEWEDIFTSDTSTKDQYPAYIENIHKLASTKQQPGYNGQRTRIDTFPRDAVQVSKDPSKGLRITNHQENANQTHKQVPPSACQNGRHQREGTYQVLRRTWGERHTQAPPGGCQTVQPPWKTQWKSLRN